MLTSIEVKKELGYTCHRLILFHIFLKQEKVQLLFLEYVWSIEEKKELGSTCHRLILFHIFLKEEEVLADELEFQLLFLEYGWSGR
jgi:hypothetical protein